MLFHSNWVTASLNKFLFQFPSFTRVKSDKAGSSIYNVGTPTTTEGLTFPPTEFVPNYLGKQHVTRVNISTVLAATTSMRLEESIAELPTLRQN